LFRHDDQLLLATQWNPSKRKTPITLTEACARDLGLTVEDLPDLAQERNKWADMVMELHTTLAGEHSYISVRSPSWAAARQAIETVRDAEFVEEGQRPYVMQPTVMHAYTDGSRLQHDDRVLLLLLY
jgi:hypothetical protein